MTLADHFMRKLLTHGSGMATIGSDAIRSVQCTVFVGVIITCTDGSKLIHKGDDYCVDNSGYKRYIHGKGNVVVGNEL